eukprot:g3985.t1
MKKQTAERLEAMESSGLFINLNARAFIAEFTMYNADVRVFTPSYFLVEMPREGFYQPSFRYSNFCRISYVSAGDFKRMGLSIVVVILLLRYLHGELSQMSETWEEPAKENSLFFDDTIAKERKARKKLYRTITGDDPDRADNPDNPDSGNRPVLAEVLLPDTFDAKDGSWQYVVLDKCRKCLHIVIRPYFYEVFNYFDIMLMMCLAALVVLQVVQLALESSLSLEDNQGFVSISFIIGELHHSRMMLFGWATFFGWFKMFEYLRITESFAIMFFIIVGTTRHRSSTLVNSLISRFSGTLGDVDFESARESQPFWGEFLLVIFVVFMVLLLLNLLIAVMSEAYEEVKELAEARWAAATPLPPLPCSAAGSIFSEASSYYTSDGYASEFGDFEPPPPRELSSKERSDLLYRHRFVPLSKFALYRAPFGGRRHTIWGDDPVRLRARLEALEAEAKDGDLLAIQTFGEKRQARLAAYDVCPRRRNSFATLRGLEEKEMRPRLLRRRQQRKGLIRVLQGYYLDGVPQSADAEETGTEGAEFNTPTALLQRETLVFHPVIRTMLEKIWEVTDEDGSGGIELDEYLIIQRKLYCSLVENRYGQAEDAEGRKAWKKIALEDWDTDRRECEDIDKRKFFNSWFALVDIWTGDISAESYIAMLSTLFHSITTKDPDTQLIEFL